MKDAKGGGAVKLLLALIGLIALLAIGFGAYMGLNLSKQRAFVVRANSACNEAARVDYDFGKVLDSPGHSRDQVLVAASTASKRIGDLENGLSGANAGRLGDLKSNLCAALGEHGKLYDAIGQETRSGDVASVRQAVESAWRSYGAVDRRVIPLAGVLPGMAADSLVAGLRNMKGSPPVAVHAPKPQPTVETQAPPPPPPPPSAPADTGPILHDRKAPPAPLVPASIAPGKSRSVPAVVSPVPAPRPPKPKVTRKKPIAPKKPKAPRRAKTATFRCPYRGCNAWFVKASLLQRHKKFCIYRPGGLAARSRNK